MASAIEVRNLRRTYGDVIAVDGISFDVADGEIFGLVGPNGAGKTTTIECLEGLRRPTSGQVRVLGMDPFAQRRVIAERIGVQLQESALPARLHVEEALALFGSLYRRCERVDDLLEQLALTEKRTAAFAKLSGGQKQRLFIALALVNRPEMVFFDELTTGLDPQARRSMWDLVRQIRDRGCTVVLTTHYMEEAERLCDRVMIVDQGRIVALDTPDSLIGSLGADTRIVFGLPEAQDVASLMRLPTVSKVERSDGHVIVYGHGDRFASSVVSHVGRRRSWLHRPANRATEPRRRVLVVDRQGDERMTHRAVTRNPAVVHRGGSVTLRSFGSLVVVNLRLYVREPIAAFLHRGISGAGDPRVRGHLRERTSRHVRRVRLDGHCDACLHGAHPRDGRAARGGHHHQQLPRSRRPSDASG